MENFEETACLCALGKIFGFKPKDKVGLYYFKVFKFIGHLSSPLDYYIIFLAISQGYFIISKKYFKS